MCLVSEFNQSLLEIKAAQERHNKIKSELQLYAYRNAGGVSGGTVIVGEDGSAVVVRRSGNWSGPSSMSVEYINLQKFGE